MVLLRFKALIKLYSSVDIVFDIEGGTLSYWIFKFFKPSGDSTGQINSKGWSPIILLRNSCLPKLYNSTRLQIKSLNGCLLMGTIRIGYEADVPRLPMIPITN